MAELPTIKLPRAAVGDEVVVSSEDTGQVWNIVATNSKKTRRRFRAMTAPTVVTPTPPVYTFEETFDVPTVADLKRWGVTQWPTTGLSKESDNMGDLRQCSIVNGQLRIRCERGSTPSGRAWRSGAIGTRIYGKPPLFAQMFGRFEARMKLPKGKGLWPAFWLLAVAGTGYVQEIDVIEAYPGYRGATPSGGTTTYAVTSHYGAPSSSALPTHDFWPIAAGVDLTDDFHVFGIEWRKDFIAGLLDGKEVGRIVDNIPAEPMFLVLDNVVGAWGGMLSDASTPSPADLIVDWVRVQA